MSQKEAEISQARACDILINEAPAGENFIDLSALLMFVYDCLLGELNSTIPLRSTTWHAGVTLKNAAF